MARPRRSKEKPVGNPYAPRYWLTWLGWGMMWLLAQLPFRWRIRLGRLLGSVLYHLATGRKHVARTNLRLCFPELNETEREQLLKRVFLENSIGFLETAYSYAGREEELQTLTEYRGLALLQEAAAKNRGVILIGAHYSMLDLGGILLKPHCGLITMYRANSNPLLNELIRRGRAHFIKGNYERHNLRPVLKHLKQGDVVWYAPDQDYGRKVSVFAPFFGVQAATITTTSKLAQFNQSPVLMLSYHRKADDSGYVLRIEPGPAEFPSGDDALDAALINAALERMIRYDPAQYMWVHRRFKTRPAGELDPYAAR